MVAGGSAEGAPPAVRPRGRPHVSTPVATTGVVMHAVNQPKFVCQVKHGPSGTTIQTEAPKDNGGTGMSFSPTDLVGAALATCMLTTMQLYASREGLPWGEASATVEKRMTPPPRRIGELVVEIRMPRGLDAQQRPPPPGRGRRGPRGGGGGGAPEP
ncbi:MAG: OsmC family protein, partial [Myxococcaceae bacterium]|nr:OsmC family protein [Myxococcaceae bacterium]